MFLRIRWKSFIGEKLGYNILSVYQIGAFRMNIFNLIGIHEGI